jgi:protein-S-isoprenylcysteine O-methyltransferase Ste14
MRRRGATRPTLCEAPGLVTDVLHDSRNSQRRRMHRAIYIVLFMIPGVPCLWEWYSFSGRHHPSNSDDQEFRVYRKGLWQSCRIEAAESDPEVCGAYPSIFPVTGL